MEPRATPPIRKSKAVATTVQEATREGQLEDWKSELADHVHCFNGDLQTFLELAVPSDSTEDWKKNPVTPSAFSDHHPSQGTETQSYPALIKGLRAVVDSFPSGRQPKFLAHHRKELPFPFPKFASDHYSIFPDLCVLFPGSKLPPRGSGARWPNIASLVEVKRYQSDDPFLGDSFKRKDTLVQMAVGARALMAVHGHSSVFTLGFYGSFGRIVRWDHSSVVASPQFSLKDNPGCLQEFFWRLFHPYGVQGNLAGSKPSQWIVGGDPTIRKLTTQEETWLKSSLKAAGLSVDLSVCRHVEVQPPTDADGLVSETIGYFRYELVYLNPRLLSRATSIWRAVKDPRHAYSGDKLGKFPSPQQGEQVDLKIAVVKETWRQLARNSEQDIVDRIEATIAKEERTGLPTQLLSWDLGEAALCDWQAATGQDFRVAIDATHQPKDLDSEGSESPPGSTRVSLPTDSVLRDHPLPFQQTFTWRFFGHCERRDDSSHDEESRRDRSHMRFVTTTIGRPVTEFKSTLELCMAFHDAIAAHKTLWEKASILHRDINVGNILIVDKDLDRESGCKGFLCDFDYSLTSVGKGKGKRIAAAEESFNLKERTDAHPFMAITLLEVPGLVEHTVHHDLESFFWVLLWVVLRHTNHTHPDGGEACTKLFGTSSNVNYGSLKRGYLFGPIDIGVKDNLPLTQLLCDFKLCCHERIGYNFEPVDPMSYHEVLCIFDRAIQRDDWPLTERGLDKALPVSLPETRLGGASSGNAGGSGKPRDSEQNPSVNRLQAGAVGPSRQDSNRARGKHSEGGDGSVRTAKSSGGGHGVASGATQPRSKRYDLRLRRPG